MNLEKVIYPVVMVGVVPPPFHGQGIATKAVFDAKLASVEKILVEICSSKKITDVGRPSLGKFLGVFGIIARILRGRFSSRSEVMYYTAGSGAWVPFVRDLLILGICRPFFKRTVIHYHSGNVVDFLDASPLRTFLGRHIYGRGAWSIRLGEGCPVPDERFGAGRVVKIPNGIDPPPAPATEWAHDRFRILFLGNLFEEKGILDLIEAVEILVGRIDAKLELSMVGAYPDEASERLIRDRLEKLDSRIDILGPAPAYGDEKWAAFARADVFVFPSYYERENMPLVVIEAMAASLPVIATDWRGIPELVQEGETGFLVPRRSPTAIAVHLETLATTPKLRQEMGCNARQRYLDHFTMGIHVEAIGGLLVEAARS